VGQQDVQERITGMCVVESTCVCCVEEMLKMFFRFTDVLSPAVIGGVCGCERLADGWGTTVTTRVPGLRIGERPREWTRG